ncbi:hypothetical protein C9374_009389 [Naegleria lovaniensis]|uniref:Uncharacterized protein n=1 Tax=Naegleria lovaniensis TaxID=51637 RepID=A0AA88GFC3_NAELO|nr:uncharacterized protein C9374_009389 [Naegleria lovaniensis]KAG2377478.1 hypothetical protein C9374_009389 [Naegleria lovaniensis]
MLPNSETSTSTTIGQPQPNNTLRGEMDNDDEREQQVVYTYTLDHLNNNLSSNSMDESPSLNRFLPSSPTSSSASSSFAIVNSHLDDESRDNVLVGTELFSNDLEGKERQVDLSFSELSKKRTRQIKVEELRKKEAAYKLLLKNEEKKKRRMQKAIDQKMEIEKEKKRLEMAEKTLDNITIWKKIEETRKKNVQKKIALLQSSAFNVYMSKVNLIKKLTEIEVKESLNQIVSELHASPSNHQQSLLSHEQVKKQAREEQRKIVQEQANHHAKHHHVSNMSSETSIHSTSKFAQNLQLLTSLSKTEEDKEIDQSTRKYLKNSMQHRHDSIVQAHKHSEEINNKVIEQLILSKKQQVESEFDKKIVHDHLEKVKKLTYASNVVGLESEALKELLELPEEQFETDIGVADAEMDSIRVEIYNLEAKRRQNQSNHSQHKLEIKEFIEVGEQKKKRFKQVLPKLKQELQIIKQEAAQYEEEYGGMSLTTMDEQMTANVQEMKRLKSEGDQILVDLQSSLQQTRQELESQIEDLTLEVAEAEKKAQECQEKVNDACAREKSREERLTYMQQSIEKLKDGCQNFASNFEKRKKQAHIQTNQKYAEIIMFHDLKNIMEKAKRYYTLELGTALKDNTSLMEYLNTRVKNLKERLAVSEQAMQKSIEYATFLKSLTHDSVYLEHTVMSKYLEVRDQIVTGWRKSLESKVRLVAQQNCRPFIERERATSVVKRFINMVWMRDMYKSAIGVIIKPEDASERDRDLERVRQQVEQQTFKEQRLAVLLLELYRRYEKQRLEQEPEKVKQEEKQRIMEITRAVERHKQELLDKIQYESESDAESDIEDSDIETNSESDYFSEEEDQFNFDIPSHVDVIKEEFDALVENIKGQSQTRIHEELEEVNPTPESGLLGKDKYKKMMASRKVGYSFLEKGKPSVNEQERDVKKQRILLVTQKIMKSVQDYIDFSKVDKKMESVVIPNIKKQQEHQARLESNLNRNEQINRVPVTTSQIKQGINQVTKQDQPLLGTVSFASIPVIRPTSIFGD